MAEAEDEIDGILREDLEPQEKISQVKRVYNRLQLAERCQELTERYSAQAADCLTNVELDHDARDFFTELCTKAAARNH